MKEENCIFCRIAQGEIPAEGVYEDDSFKVILDLAPASRGHMLILPKAHFRDLSQADEATLGKAFYLAGRLGRAAKKALGATGFNVLANTGESAGQTVFHLHVHVIPRFEGDGRMVSWNPGVSDPDQQREVAAALSKAL